MASSVDLLTDVIVYEKLPESDPLVTPAFDEGVSQDEGISSEGFTKAPAEPAATAPLQAPSKSSNNMEILFPTPPAPEPTIPQPPPAPHIRYTERTIHPTWVKAAANAEKARAAAIMASNKVQHELREARHQQKAVAEANTQEPACKV
ncbi:hypothetical protein PILCRDRAFT_7800, partial [Piloderma croceum F 1598]